MVKLTSFYLTFWAFIVESIIGYPAVEDSSEYGVTPGRLATNCTCGLSNKAHGRIIGGTDSSPHEWPMMAGLIAKTGSYKKNALVCGGTLITRRHVVTAGHCVHTLGGVPLKPEQLSIVLGAHKLSQINYNDPAVMRNAERFIAHPKYKPPGAYDLAVIVLEKLVEFSSTISPACLPTQRINPLGKKLIAVGWGFMDFKATQPDALQKVPITVVRLSVCAKVYKEFDVKEGYQFCTFQGGNKGQCVGDSGGPIVWLDPDTNRYTLLAAPSFSKAGCVIDPAVVSDISYYLPWIQLVISETYSEERTCAKLEQANGDKGDVFIFSD